MRTLRTALAGTTLTVFLAACGGGGGGGGAAAPIAPANLTYGNDRAIYLVGIAIDANVATVDGTVTSFSVTPPLPVGLMLDPQTGELTGTPAGNAPLANYTITASNSGGSTNSVLRLEIALPPRFLLTANSADSTISTYTVDPATGALDHHTFAAATIGETGPETLVMHPSGRFLYVPNSASNNISVYRMDLDGGWLTAGTPIATGVGPHKMSIHPNGNFAFVASETSNEMHVYGISPLTGELSLVGAPIPTLSQPGSMALAPSGNLLLIGNLDFPRRLTIYDVDSVSGALTTTTPGFNLNGGLPVAITFDRAGVFAFIALENYNAVIPIQIDAQTKVLTLAAPGATKDQPSSISVHPSGDFTYVTSLAGGSVSGFRVDRDTGALTPLTSSSTVSLPENAIFDPSGRFMYVLSRGARDVLAFRVDDKTGELTLQGRIPARSSPTSLVMIQGNLPLARSTRYAYSANEASDDVSAFAVDPLTGVLTEIGLAALTGDQPSSVAVDPRGRFVYVGNAGDGTVSMFSVDAFTGGLFEIAPPVSVGSVGSATSEPVSVTVDRSGRFLYSANRGAGTLGVFTIDQATGALFQIATLVVTDGLLNPEHVGVDPTGQVLFVSASGDGTPGTSGVSIMNIDPRTGVPVRSTNPGLATGVTNVSFHPTGRFLYAIIEGTDELATFEVNRNTGALTEVLPRVSDGDMPSALSIDRTGSFAYAAIQDPAGTGHVSVFPIDQATGLLTTATAQFVGGARPIDLAVDATGTFLHVGNADSNDITTFRIDAATGLLAPPASTLTGLAPSALSIANAIQ